MAVDDLWFRKERDKNDDRLPAQRHGRGKRWRVRWTDPETGKKREELFDRKTDADKADANRQADISRGQYIDPKSGKITVAEYAEFWRGNQLHRDSTMARIESTIRMHVVPVLGKLPLASVRPSHLQRWVKDRSGMLAPSTLRTCYSTTLAPMFRAAMNDRLIGVSPCVGIRLPDLVDGEYLIATAEQVFALADALPARYQAIPVLAAGCGWRAGEILGLELDGVNFLRREIHMRNQLKVIPGRKPFLCRPKTKASKRTNELPQVVATALARHIEAFPPHPVELDDETSPPKVTRRDARLLFTKEDGDSISRSVWSKAWAPAVQAAGLPEGYGLRDLRHYFATVLIHGGAHVKTVQLAMGHTTPTVTLNTYTGYWPDVLDRTRTLVDNALGEAATSTEDLGTGEA